jgi:ABC-2 type transport system ATP-binding protein
VQLADDIQTILNKHKRLIGPRQDEAALASVHTIVEASHTERQTTLLVRTNGHIFDTSWQIQEASLEDVVLAYLSQQVTEELQSSSSTRGERSRMEVVK